MNKFHTFAGAITLVFLTSTVLAFAYGQRDAANQVAEVFETRPELLPEELRYELEMEAADARRRTAQARCTGMVGAARESCQADADGHYDALVRLAERRKNYVEIRSDRIAFRK
ncbi:MAG: hypothetical protein V4709_06750 [Pseudomonadota bacterium]